eukprot:SAG31_NODE_3728_length_3948_cov_1.597504_8_plen_79_part_00
MILKPSGAEHGRLGKPLPQRDDPQPTGVHCDDTLRCGAGGREVAQASRQQNLENYQIERLAHCDAPNSKPGHPIPYDV